MRLSGRRRIDTVIERGKGKRFWGVGLLVFMADSAPKHLTLQRQRLQQR